MQRKRGTLTILILSWNWYANAVTSRVLADAEFFNSRISKIDGAGDLGEHIVNVVQSKEVLNTAAPPAESSAAPAEDWKDQQKAGEVEDGAKPAESQESAKEEQAQAQAQI